MSNATVLDATLRNATLRNATVLNATARNATVLDSTVLDATAMEQAPTDGLFVVAAAPAGWYDVADDVRRWFDGRRWTDHYAPKLTLVPELEPEPVRLHRRTDHGLHAILVVMTLGAWTPVWAGVALVNSVRVSPLDS